MNFISIKNVCLLWVVCFTSVNIFAQSISLKSVSLSQSDLRASTNPRVDKTGKSCAIIKVDVIGVKDLEFADAIGDVDYNLGEYIVYVPEGIKELKYKNASGSISGAVNFDDYGLEVETKRVYSVVFESENHIRAAKFSIQPQNAKLLFDGNVISLDENGLASIEKPVGKYPFIVEAKGFEPQSGMVELLEDNIFTTTIIALRQKMYPLTIICSTSDAFIFIDNVPYGRLNEKNVFNVPDGKHSVRLIADGFVDYEKFINVKEQALTVNASLQKIKEEKIKFKNERTRTSANIRNGWYCSLSGEFFYDEHEWGGKAEVYGIQHFWTLFAAREGIGGGVTNHCPEPDVSAYLDIPLQLGVSFPFGKYNNYLFSTFLGGYTQVTFSEDEKVWSVGLRLSAQLDLNKFIIGGDWGYDFMEEEFSYGLRIGYKFH